MNLGPHAAFILAAYAVATVVIAALIAWIAIDHRAQKRVLGDLDAKGVARRSAGVSKDLAKEPAKELV